MKQRFWAAVLTVALVLSTMSGVTFAEESANALSYFEAEEPSTRGVETASPVLKDETATLDHDHSTWTAWTDTTTLPSASGNYYLENDVAVSTYPKLGASAVNITLCLNGHTVSGGTRHYDFNGTAEVHLTICDCLKNHDTDGNLKVGTLTGAASRSIMTQSAAKNVTVTLQNIVLKNNQSGDWGGAVRITGSNNKLIAENVTFDGNYTTGASNSMGAALYLGNNNRAELKNCIFKGNTVNNDGGAIYATGANAVLTLESCDFTDNKAANGGAIYANALTLNTKDCAFGKNNATSGGAIYANGVKSMTVEGGSISENTATADGGAIRLNNCKPTLKNLTVRGNEGGSSTIYVAGGSCATLDGVKITENHATSTGKYAGCVYVVKGSQAILKNAVEITGNTRGTAEEASDLFLQNNNPDDWNALTAAVLDVSALTAGTKIALRTFTTIGETELNKYVLTGLSSDWKTSWVYYTNAEKYVAYDAENARAVLEDLHSHCLCGGTSCAQCDHSAIEWTAWKSTTSLPTESGYYYLTGDVALAAVADLSGGKNVVLCLNGHTVTVDGTKAAHGVYALSGGAKLTVTDCGNGGFVATNNDGANAISITGSSTFNLYGGTFDGFSRTGSVGATVMLLKDGKGTFNMYGGEIKNSEAQQGGAVYVHNTATFNLYGGKLTDCTANAAEGGAVFAQTNGAVNLYGGELSGNSAKTYGGAVSCWGTLNISGGTFTGNTASKQGAGVYVKASTKLTLSGAPTITGNTLNGEENNLFLADAAVFTLGTMTDGANIGVSVANNATRAISAETATDCSAYFHADAEGYAVTYQDGTLCYGFAVNAHRHSVCCDATCTEHSKQLFRAWNKTDSLPTSGYWYLNVDVTPNAAAVLNGTTLVLCLNGHTINAASAKTAFTLKGSATLTITDCTAKTDGQYTAGAITGATASAIKGEKAAGATVNLYAGKLTNNIRTTDGSVGGVLVFDEPASGVNTFNMYGGELSDNGAKNHGGALYLRKNCVANIYGGTFLNNKASDYDGGAIRVLDGGTLHIFGGTFTGNTAKASGGAICAEAGSTVSIANAVFSENAANNGGALALKCSACVLENVEIVDNTATENGGGILLNGCAVTLGESVKIHGNAAKQGAGVVAQAGASLTLAGAEIYDNAATAYGGGVYVSTKTSFAFVGGSVRENTAKSGGGIALYCAEATVKNAEIAQNSASENGGGIFMNGCAVTIEDGTKICGNSANNAGGVLSQNGASVTLKGGEISENTAKIGGGGLYISKNTTLSMSGGKVSDNTAKYGGGVYALNSTLNIGGGEISENAATEQGGGIYPTAETKISLSGAPIINGNTVSEAANNLWLNAEQKLTVGEMTEGAKIGLSAPVSPTPYRAAKSETDTSKYFVSDNSYLKVTYDSGIVYLAANGEHAHCLCGGTACAQCDHSAIEWTAWKSTTTLPSASGHYYLLSDVNLSTSATVNGADIALCLNGHTVTVDGTKAAHGVYELSGGAKLTITDCGNGGFVATNNDGANAIRITGSSTFNLYGGTFDGFSRKSGVGATVMLLKDGKGTFNMYGGEIKNSEAQQGGAVYVHDTATFNLYGGKLTDCTANAAEGGAVFAQTNGTVNLYGGELSGNSAKTYGGAVSCWGTLNISGGKLSENTAANGGALYAKGSATLTGGTVIGNTATANGGGIALYGAEATVKNVEIANNTATVGGGIFLNGCALTVEDGTKIHGNSANEAGGVLSQSGASVTLKGGEISENTAKNGGGGLYISKGTTLTMNGGKLCTNTAKNGAAIYALSGTLNIGGGELSGNTAENNGGAIYARKDGKDCCVKISGGVFSENRASAYDGGAICAEAGSTVSITDAVFTKNAANRGGALALKCSACVLENVEIADNTATESGGGIFLNGCAVTLDETVKIHGNAAKHGAGIVAQSGASLTLAGAELYDNAATAYGGGVYVSTKTSFAFVGGSVRENTAKSGGGIALYCAEATVKNAEIAKNSASENGGGIFLSGCALTIEDGAKISGNSATNAGGVLSQNSASVTLKGGEISENTAKNGGGGLYISKNTTLDMSGGKVSANTAKYGAGLYALNSTVGISGGEFSKNTVSNYGGAIYANGAAVTIKGGSFTNNSSQMLGGMLATSQSATLDIYDGAVFSGGSASSGSILLIQKDGVVNIHGGTFRDSTAKKVGTLYVSSGSTLNMYGGSVYGNTVGDTSGAVFVAGQFNLYGGVLSYNTAGNSGGGVCLANVKGRMNMYGGSISNNSCVKQGGGVYVGNECTVVFAGGEISGNTSGKNGGGVMLYQANAEFSGNVEISENEAGGNGGGIMASNGSTVVLNKAKLFGNRAVNGGGMLVQSKTSSLRIDDCDIYENTTASNGGGFYVSYNCTFEMNGGAVHDNHAEANGGGMYLDCPSVINDGRIYANSANGTGGGVFFNRKGVSLDMNGGEISGNTAARSGGLRVSYLTFFTMNGGKISENTATEGNGGAMEIYGKASLGAVEISKNTAAANGGGIWETQQCVLTTNGTQILNNTAGAEGGGICAGLGSFTYLLDGTVISGNRAGTLGGGLWAIDDTTFEGCTVTGNEAEAGGGVYLAPSQYDGESYFVGVFKLGGDTVIRDNTGDDLFIDEGTAVAISSTGLGKNAYLGVRLHSGTITNTIFGEYDYEGADLNYIVTYGTRSITDPEAVLLDTPDVVVPTEPTGADEPTRESDSTLVVLIIAAVAVLAVGMTATVLLTRRKKQTKTKTGGKEQ